MINLVKEFFKKKYYFFGIFIILLVAFGLRFYKLSVVPAGMTWDEAAIGYNGYAVLTTRRDEWLHRLPISFMSFGDYKAPLAIYLNGLFTLLFGMNLWAVRLPFAIASIFAILGLIYLTNILFNNKKMALIAGILMTFSPWHYHYSRVGFESGLALALMVWGFYFFIKFIKKSNLPAQAGLSAQAKNICLFTSSILFVLSLYTYHSAKIMIPLALIAYIFIHKIKLIKLKFFIILSVLLSMPLIYDSFFGQGLTRAGTLVFSENNLFTALLIFIKNFFYHLSPAFLVSGATTTLRHGDGQFGIFFPITLFFILFSFFRLLAQKNAKLKINKNLIFSLALALIGIFPAALGTEVPHSNRALLALPGFLILASFSINYFLANIKYRKLFFIFIIIYFTNFFVYLNNYFTNFAKNSASDFKEGYLEAFNYVKDFEKSKDKIIFTSDYGQPYIYALFVKKTNPIWYQGGSLIKYEFTDKIDINDLSRKNSVIVASNTDEIPNDLNATKTIFDVSGAIRFKIFVTE